jgi:hypothetical protein
LGNTSPSRSLELFSAPIKLLDNEIPAVAPASDFKKVLLFAMSICLKFA